jgi:hypothetical protein
MSKLPGTPGPCFEDLSELDHVAYLLREEVGAIEICPDYDLASNSPIKPLLNAIEAQRRWQREENDKRYPGAFDRSYLIEEYDQAVRILEFALWHPKSLAGNLDRLILQLHRLMIIGDMSEDQLIAMSEKLAEAEKLAEFAKPFKENSGKVRRPNAVRAAINKALKKSPELSNDALWITLKASPPKGYSFCETPKLGRYIDGPAPIDGMEYRRFMNIASEERKKLGISLKRGKKK